MSPPKELLRRNPIVREIFFLIVADLIVLNAYLGWRHFHHESAYSENPQDQERAESLTDH